MLPTVFVAAITPLDPQAFHKRRVSSYLNITTCHSLLGGPPKTLIVQGCGGVEYRRNFYSTFESVSPNFG
ncbi:hypothetical protein BDZ91DRAFT_719803 [Kalaharituber pfeilii]|nr:hypothetical protein BDZ91DRAFT_719803 [Kalaharituber pfeilii]